MIERKEEKILFSLPLHITYGQDIIFCFSSIISPGFKFVARLCALRGRWLREQKVEAICKPSVFMDFVF